MADARKELIEKCRHAFHDNVGYNSKDKWNAVIDLVLSTQPTKEQVMRSIPTNWCDPLLTGNDKVLPDGYDYKPSDIEALLRAIKKSLYELYGESGE